MPAANRIKPQQHKEELPLSKAAHMLLEECRMVLPGIQALFGFQLIAVFNSAFDQKLTEVEQHLHFTALSLVAVAVALIMAPAALHRQAGMTEITDAFLKVSTRLVLWSMWPLLLGICIDFYIVARVLIGGTLAPWFAALLCAIFIVLWFVLPRAQALQQLTIDGAPSSRR
jgi:hypothetical protein